MAADGFPNMGTSSGKSRQEGTSYAGANRKQTAATPIEEAAATKDRPSILVAAGRIDKLATLAEAAVLESSLPVFQRGRELVRPVYQEVPASRGRTTLSAGLAEITRPAMLDLLSRAADWCRFDRRANAEITCNPPPLAADLILSRVGEWTFPSIAGVITTPTLRPDGTILDQPGYDQQTRLFQVADPALKISAIPDAPSKSDALTALDILTKLLDEFPFVTRLDKSVALSALITPIVRGAVPVAALHAICASTAGTGKSYLADVASAIATGRPCPVMAVSGKPEETESRLIGLLLAGFPLISIDNVNGELGGDTLSQAVERPTVRVRRLGASDIFEIESRATFFATGNGLRVRGDMTRRTIICTLDAALERPESREFTHRPIEDVLTNRGRYVAAALTIVRAYVAAGFPCKKPHFASFEEWSDYVRSALCWLGLPDPVDTTETARQDDPELTELREILTCWADAIGKNKAVTIKEAREIASQRALTVMGEPPDFLYPEFRDALLAVSGFRGEIDGLKLAHWLRGKMNRIVNGLRIARGTDDKHAKAPTWRVC
jgi:putative DNA primase/helicase